MLRSIDAMANPNVAPIEPPPEAQPSELEDEARARAGLEQHLSEMLARLQVAAQESDGPKRNEEMTDLAGEYVLGLLEGQIMDDSSLEAQLIRKGARTVEGNWRIESDLFTHLVGEMARSLPTRLNALRSGQYKDTTEFNAGMIKQLRNLVARYTPRQNPYEDRQQPTAMA